MSANPPSKNGASILTRRQFLAYSALTAGATAFSGCAPTSTALRTVPRRVAATEKLNIGIIGCGGKGGSDTAGVATENIVALCDVDENTLNHAAKKYPGAKLYRDYRKMLDEMKELDAVTVSTPDHHHAPAALRAISRGLHTYVQKPLAHNISEVRKITEAARKHRVATQLGNQGQSGEEIRRTCEIIWSGAIGDVHEVHIWTNRPIWPQGQDRPAGEDPVPKNLDWDLWLGPAPMRPYKAKYPHLDKAVYHPFTWRGWWDFGTGALGDIGCHAINWPIWALKLGAPTTVEVVDTAEVKKESAPLWSIIRYQFPKRGNLPPVALTWYDGGKMPPKPEELGNGQLGEGGTIYIGDKGKMLGTRLIPESKMKEFKPPAKTLPRVKDHYQNWIEACKGGTPACSNFDIAGPLTEIVLLGNIALRAGKKLEWDSAHMRIKNCPEANQYLSREYRKGWEV